MKTSTFFPSVKIDFRLPIIIPNLLLALWYAFVFYFSANLILDIIYAIFPSVHFVAWTREVASSFHSDLAMSAVVHWRLGVVAVFGVLTLLFWESFKKFFFGQKNEKLIAPNAFKISVNVFLVSIYILVFTALLGYFLSSLEIYLDSSFLSGTVSFLWRINNNLDRYTYGYFYNYTPLLDAVMIICVFTALRKKSLFLR